ncbi:Coq4 family protein [Polyangium mundeleinium]|uniref:Coq4 family protein n=1 Tax=Polyangium mundeleinium TaxID=2995306 RepID=A0ABT5ETT7_9BACT|nr:Coq4 family protein [Polyangium mundeleinium]MDC0744205.1 Coq4 family protein [Polyangium mundeleinium]
MVSWKQVGEVLRAWREGASLGDIAVMKFDMLGGSPPDINARLRAQGRGCLEVDLDALRALPEGTVGRAYARLLDRSGLRPLTMSAAIQARFAENPYALRYTSTHDLFHLLTGFPTTPAGEIGLYAFMMAQGFGARNLLHLWGSAAVYALLMPLHAPGILHNVRVGLSMGKKAKILIEAPFEEMLADPIEEVRQRLGLPDPASAGIAPGKKSLLAEWLIPKDQAASMS